MTILAILSSAIASAGLPGKAVQFLGPTVHVLGRGAQDFLRATHPESDGGGKITKAEWAALKGDMLAELDYELEKIAADHIGEPEPVEPEAPTMAPETTASAPVRGPTDGPPVATLADLDALASHVDDRLDRLAAAVDRIAGQPAPADPPPPPPES